VFGYVDLFAGVGKKFFCLFRSRLLRRNRAEQVATADYSQLKFSAAVKGFKLLPYGFTEKSGAIGEQDLERYDIQRRRHLDGNLRAAK